MCVLDCLQDHVITVNMIYTEQNDRKVEFYESNWYNNIICALYTDLNENSVSPVAFPYKCVALRLDRIISFRSWEGICSKENYQRIETKWAP